MRFLFGCLAFCLPLLVAPEVRSADAKDEAEAIHAWNLGVKHSLGGGRQSMEMIWDDHLQHGLIQLIHTFSYTCS